MFCKHKWKVLSDKMIPSMFETIANQEGELNFNVTSKTPTSFFRTVHHVVICCELCGATREYKAHNG